MKQTGTGSVNGPVNGSLSSIPSPTMPHSFGLAPAGSSVNGVNQSGPGTGVPGAPDPNAVYTNGLAQAYPARELHAPSPSHSWTYPYHPLNVFWWVLFVPFTL